MQLLRRLPLGALRPHVVLARAMSAAGSKHDDSVIEMTPRLSRFISDPFQFVQEIVAPAQQKAEIKINLIFCITFILLRAMLQRRFIGAEERAYLQGRDAGWWTRRWHIALAVTPLIANRFDGMARQGHVRSQHPAPQSHLAAR